MNHSIATRPLQSCRRPALAVAALCAAATAAAVPVELQIGGLPPGLAAAVTVDRNVCPDGEGWIANPAQKLTERTMVGIDPATGAKKTFTVYGASFDTPATANSEKRCSVVSTSPDKFRFAIRVPGYDAKDQPQALVGALATTAQAPVSLALALGARTTAFTPAMATLPRGMARQVDAKFVSSLGGIQMPRLDFLRPLPAPATGYQKVASVYRAADGTPCVQGGGVTNCYSGTDLPVAGGVMLQGIRFGVVDGQYAAHFEFTLMHDFLLGPVKVRALANATDLSSYLVNGVPQALDLLPWQAMEQDSTVQ